VCVLIRRVVRNISKHGSFSILPVEALFSLPSLPVTCHNVTTFRMKYTIAAVVAALAVAASARHCTNITVPVSISARNGVFNVTAPANDIDVTNFFLDLTQQGKNFSANVLQGVSHPGINTRAASTNAPSSTRPSPATTTSPPPTASPTRARPTRSSS